MLFRKMHLKPPSNRWSRRLPPLRDSEHMLVSFLKWSAWVLVIGIITGFALRQVEGQSLLYLDHKMLLTLLGFAVICGLIFIHENPLCAGVWLFGLCWGMAAAYPGIPGRSICFGISDLMNIPGLV